MADAIPLADGDAVREVLGVRWSDKQLGVPSSPRRVEGIVDPKKVLHQLEARITRRFDAYLELLGEVVSIDTLRKVPAFAQWWDDTRAALSELGFVRRR